ncbi:hypothetical protein [Hahella ganghwensis]|uniref:hypothetical protein n=1 Tax=Hahella ganghwensis TaxID=286420 RepID=UPI00037A4D9D|nr:hypothetical protein [Hahella ganghwensis]
MRTDNSNFVGAWGLDVVNVAYVIELSFDEANTDVVYFTSGPIQGLTGEVYEGVLQNISGTSQKISPDKGLSTIGSLTFHALDIQGSGTPAYIDLTDLQSDKLSSSDKGLKGKRARFWVGATELDWSDFIMATTQVVSEVVYEEGKYTFNCSDVQRLLREDIFDVKKTALSQSVAAGASTIPVYDTSDFEMVKQPVSPSGITDASGQTVGYIMLPNKCVVRYTGKTANSFTGCTWGVLDTAHLIEDIEKSNDSNKDNAPVIEEYVYLEMPAPMLLYALLTGSIYGYAGEFLPDHWHLGVDAQYIRTSDFLNIGSDLWDLTNFDEGLAAVVRGQSKVDGKKYIEEQLLLLMGCFSPVYSSGEMGLRRRTVIHSSGSYIRELNVDSNVKDYGELTHNMDSVINLISIQWSYDPVEKTYRRVNAVSDSDSITRHGVSKLKEIKFKTLHSSRHSFDVIKNHFDALRDAYAGPPLEITLVLLADNNDLEVGDIVRVKLENVADYTNTTGTLTLDRNFEIQQISTDWETGDVVVRLLGSSQPAGAIPPQEPGTAITDSWYSSAGTEINETNFPGQVTEVGGVTHVTGTITLTGGSNLRSSGSIFYCDQDLTVDSGARVNIVNNVQMRIRGFFQENGDMILTGGGHMGKVGGLDGTTSGIGRTLAGKGIKFGDDSQARIQSLNNEGSANPDRDWPPFLNVTVGNDGVPRGLPTDIQGNGGSGGGEAVSSIINTGTAPGGSGGDGAAGLLVVSRGADIGAAGKIKNVGGAGSPGQAFEVISTGTPAFIKAGSGAGGCPGGIYFLVDGQNNPPNITTSNCVVRFGLSPVLDGSYYILGKKHIADTVGSSWDPRYRGIENAVASKYVGTYLAPNRTFNGDGALKSASGLAENVSEAWVRVQMLTGYVAPAPEIKYAPIPSAINIQEATNTPASAQGNLSTLEISVTDPGDDAYSYSEIYYQLDGQIGWTYVGAASPEATVTVVSDGSTYNFRAFSVSKSGLRSKSYQTGSWTVEDISIPATRDTVLPLLVPIIALKQGGTEFTGRDAHFLFTDNNYQKEHFAYYQLQIYNGAILVRTEQITDRAYTYSSEKNLEDGNFREITVKVKAIGNQGQESNEATLTVDNPAPATPTGLTANPRFSSVALKFNAPTDQDYAYFEVFVDTSTPVAENSSTSRGIFYGSAVTIGGLDTGTQYYFRLKLYDVFGAGGYAEVGATTLDLVTPDELGPWASITNADLAFINTYVDNDAIPSTKIENIVAGKIATGSLAATTIITTLGIVQAVNGNIKATLGPKSLGGDVYLLSAEDNGTVIFGVKDDGGAIFTGSVTLTGNSSGYSNLSDAPDLNDVAANGGDMHSNPRGLIVAKDGRPAGVRVVSGGSTSIVSYLDQALGHIKIYSATDSSVGVAYPAFRVEPETKYRLKFRYKSDQNSASGLYVRIGEYDSELPDGVTHVSEGGVGGAEPSYNVSGDRAVLIGFENAAITTAWQTAEVTYTPTSTAKYASVNFLNWTGMGLSELHIALCSVTPIVNSDADVTADNTANDTANVNGVPSTTITANIAQAISDAASAQSTADGKIETFFQTGAPTASGVGDLWFDTDDGNRVYRWNGSSWVDSQDTEIAQAISNAAGAQATADGKVTTFYQATAPTAEGVGDLWYDTDDDIVYRWNGSNWLSSFATFGADWSSNVSNIPARFGNAPAGSGLYLTNTHLGYYDSSMWQTYMDNSGNFFLNGDSSNFLSWNGSTLQVRGDIQATSVAASISISAPTITGGSINGTSVTATTITGGTIQTSTTGARTEISDATDQIRVFNDTGNGTIDRTITLGDNDSIYNDCHLVVGNTSSNWTRNGIFGGSYSKAGILGRSINSNGVEGRALGTSAGSVGVRGSHSQNGRGVYATSYGGTACEAATSIGPSYDFYASGAGTNYGPFTGAHDALLPKIGPPYEPGDIVKAGLVIARRGVSNTILGIEVQDSPASKDTFGVIVWTKELPEQDVGPVSMRLMPEEEYVNKSNLYYLASVNGVGEGQINICDEGGDIEVGDLITSSSTLGKGMLYSGSDMRVVVAKAMEPVTWADESETTKQIACIYLCG